MRMFMHTALVMAMVAFTATSQAADKKKADAKPATAAATTMKVDPAASQVKWTGSKKLVKSSHTGTVKVKGGEITMAGDQITAGTIDIDMKSIANEDLASSPKDQAKLVGHLNSPDFFATEQHPTATFKITSVKALKPAKAGDATHEIAGTLTMKGKTEPVKPFKAVVTQKDGKAEASGTLTIDRTLYDVRYGSGKFFDNLGDKVINDDIQIDLKLVASK